MERERRVALAAEQELAGHAAALLNEREAVARLRRGVEEAGAALDALQGEVDVLKGQLTAAQATLQEQEGEQSSLVVRGWEGEGGMQAGVGGEAWGCWNVSKSE